MNKIKYIHIFFLALTIRLLYLATAHLFNISPTDCCDWSRYDQLSTQILVGNYNMDGGSFIVAPIFPLFVSLIKFVSYENTFLIIQLIQTLISSFSVYFLMKSSDIIFEKKILSIFVGIIFSLYPFTFWFVVYMGQETFFQSFLIISFYYLLKFMKYKKFRDFTCFSIIFGITLLTKSHIILFVPFLFFILLINYKDILKSLVYFVIFILIVFITCLPQSINNKNYNNYHVLSTTGVGLHFLVGHNDEFYKMITAPPKKNSEEYKRIWSMDYKVAKETKKNNKSLNHKELDKVRFYVGLNWILNNPSKATKLIFMNIKNFLQPGFNKLHHDGLKWLVSFIISFPIYILAYYAIIKNIFHNYKKHTLIISLFFTMFIFSTIFYTQNRFRVITIEPYYLMYASYSIYQIYNYLKNKKIINF